MGADDKRKDYLGQAIAAHFYDPAYASAALAQTAPLDAFLNDPSCLILRAFEKDSSVALANELPADNSGGLYFFKLRPTALDDLASFRQNVFQTSMLGAPTQALYHGIHQLFAPMLLQSAGGDVKVDTKVQTLLTDLEAGLGSVLRRGKGRVRAAEDDFGGILTPSDEFSYWEDIAEEESGNAGRRASAFFAAFEGVQSDFLTIRDKTLQDVLELVDATQDALDTAWKVTDYDPFSQDRMEHLFSLITSEFVRYIQVKLADVSLFTEPFPKVRDAVRQCMAIIERWTQATTALTTQFWPSFPEHMWDDGRYDDVEADALTARLDEILALRSVHEQLLGLLSPDEQRDFPPEKSFAAFKSVNVLHINQHTLPLWKAAKAEYEKAVAPIESRIAGKLRSRLSQLNSSPLLLLREFQKYRELVKRSNISRDLASERETLLGQLQVDLTNLREDFDNRSKNNPSNPDEHAPMGPNMPEICGSIVYSKQLTQKIEEAKRTADSLLGDLPRFKDYSESASSFVAELKTHTKEQFDEWQHDIEDRMNDATAPLTLEMNGRLMDLDYQDGKLRVHYSDRLVTLLREVRQLTAMGFSIKASIVKSAKMAEQFYRHGVVLKQVANFYNTIDQQIIPSQKTMLLDAAIAFENVVKNPKSGSEKDKDGGKAVTWNDPAQLEKYIDRLQKAAERLTFENRKLRKAHHLLIDRTVQMMNIDLLRQNSRWKESLTEIRGTCTTLSQTYREMTAWRTHWDYQLYKALEHQYQLGLESLNENLPEIKVDLVFKQQRLQFRPPFEEIRAKYYREMKKFITIPSHFSGVGDSEIFRRMTDLNAQGLLVVYRKAEDLFKRLSAVQASLVEWVALGTVDLDQYVQENLTDISDWEINFKMLKARGRDVEKIPATIKVDCITVSTAPLKAAIDDQMQRLVDALVASLKKAALGDLNEVEDFINDSMDKLATKPQSIQEIGEANSTCRNIANSKGMMQSNYARFEAKNKLLRGVAGYGIDVVGVQQRWEQMEMSVESHEVMIKEQTDVLKANMGSRIDNFTQEVDKFIARWTELKPKKVAVKGHDEAQAIVASLKDFRAELDELKKSADELISDCTHFDVTIPSFPQIADADADMEKIEAAWALFEEFLSELSALEKEDWISFRGRLYLFEDFITNWDEKLKQRETDSVTLEMKKVIDNYRGMIPALKIVRGEAMETEHWHQLFRLLDMPKDVTRENLTFGHFVRAVDQINQKMAEVKELIARAQGEVVIREALQELAVWGQDAAFVTVDHVDNNRHTPLIKEWKDLMSQVGDNQSLLQSLKDSPYYGPFEEEAGSWEKKLALLDEYLANLNQIQRKWVYLEPIFGRGALPQEQGRFKRVDDEFRNIMMGIDRDKRVVSLANVNGLKDTLKVLLDQLERCQKALADFLEEKRSKFPRFYFIGDDDLLEILGQATKPTVIQNHLQKLFAGISKVVFNDEETKITAMRSSEGEVVPLSSPVTITAEVEGWLSELSTEMKTTLAKLTAECVELNDMAKFPSQILNVAEMIHFTKKAEVAIQQRSLDQLKKELQDQLEQYTSIESGDDNVLFLKVKSLVLDLIHNIDVVDQLIEQKVTSTDAWQWMKQLRYYLNSSKKVMMRMGQGEFEYTYEYQGNAGRLVHTPLTDKCYLTLTKGLSLGMGGNPYGPAGTGKTESVKALGQAFGRQVLVFNCDEGIDFKSMGRIFMGLVKCGAWGCFDEFNRLEEDVLSAVSQQIQVIQAALKRKDPSLDLLGTTIDVDANAAIFVTLNPAGKGYGGRSKLPDNLKQLFRPVAMSAPDNDLIAEVLLFSEGFVYAKEVGRKLVSCFVLSRQLLSPQQHYDWGLRALKTILRISGQLLQTEKRKGTKIDTAIESEIVVKALRSNTLSKLTFTDAQRFKALVNDVFPGVATHDIDYGELEVAIKEVLKENGHEFLESQVSKMLQFHEACRQRMGVVIVGPSGCGKSVIWQTLRQALQKIGNTIRLYVFNPKAMPRQQLLGHMDMDTRDWNDGIITYAARQVIAEPADVHSWIVHDGDIDPEWIESLNSVLDDNRLLTMPNGERIQFGSNVNFIFETHSLQFASPATVSRMGMIYLSDEDIDVEAVIKSWLKQRPEDVQNTLAGLIDLCFYKALDWVLEQDSFVVETTRIGVVLNGLSHLGEATTKGDFVMGLIRGLGGNLAPDVRADFAREVFTWAGESAPDRRNVLDTYYDERSQSYAMYAFTETRDPTKEEVLAGHVVPTVDVQRAVAGIWPWMERMEPFILVGPEGCGKSMILRYCFKKLRSASVATLHCNAQTMASHVISKLQQSCSALTTNTGRVLRPKEGERLILYLKDLNLPKPDKYATIQLIAFLQQLVTHKGYFDSNLEFIGLQNVHIVASMNPATTVGRHQLNTRFTSTVRISFISYPQSDQLNLIYSAYMQGALSKVVDPKSKFSGSSGNLKTLATNMVDVYAEVKKKYTVDEQAHYLFTPRDITAWIVGLLAYDLKSEDVLECWIHEARRIFRDRLVSDDETRRFDNLVSQTVTGAFGSEPDAGDAYFTTFASTSDHGSKALRKVGSKDFLQLVAQGLQGYEREVKELGIYLFPEILTHLARCDRVLSRPGGSLLLTGRAGVGRRTATQLVAHIAGMQFFTPNITKDYSAKAFKIDLKAVMQLAGINGEHVVFYLEDHQIVETSFLEMINSLLSAGEIPGLYTPEELEGILGPIKQLLLEEGFQGTVFQYFVHRIKRYLHVVLAMDPTNPLFLMRCESNPALYTCCSMQWFDKWTEDGMKQIPRIMLRQHYKEVEAVDKNTHIASSIAIHQANPTATPREYVSLLRAYEHFYARNSGSTLEQLKRLQAGLDKLKEAAKTVDELSSAAETKKVELAEKQALADKAMTEITRNLEEASDQKKEIADLTVQLTEEEERLTKRSAEIQAELADVQPTLDAAKSAVGSIRAQDIHEIRSLRQPPDVVRDIIEGVMKLMGILDTSWSSMKGFLLKLKDEILNFDAHKVKQDTRSTVKKFIKSKASSFDDKAAKRASAACAPLALWLKATLSYAEILERIAPLENDQKAVSKNLDASRKRLQKLQDNMSKVDERVNALKEEFAKRTAEAEKLKAELENAQETIAKATTLLSKLDGEKVRWEQTVKEINANAENLPNFALLSASFVTYLGKAAEDLRAERMKQWSAQIGVTGFDFSRFNSTESQQLTWKAEGLPADALSIENAIVILESQRTPLIIDPTTQATEWLKEHLKDKTVEVTSPAHPKFGNTLELAVRFGKILIIQEVDQVDPLLYPLVRRDLTRQGMRATVQIGDKAVDYNENFKLFLVTRNPAPYIPPDAEPLVAIVNFSVTRSGLEGQLLGVAIKHEKPELEEKKSALLAQEEQLKLQLASLEEALLSELANSEGNLLENKALLDSLNETKAKSQTIAESLVESKSLQESLDKEREAFRGFAHVGSTIFFLIRDLAKVNHMYQFSLPSFLRLYRRTLETAEASSNVDERLAALSTGLRHAVYNYVSRSLFKADRLMFALHMAHELFPDAFQPNEWDTFTGKVVMGVDGGGGGKLPSWASADRKAAFMLLSSQFSGLVNGLKLDDASLWGKWAKSPHCERDFPSKLGRPLTPFQKVLLVQCFRPDRLETAMSVFSMDLLGLRSLSPAALNLGRLYEEETQSAEPVLLIVSAGADPSVELQQLAESVIGKRGGQFRQVAMGQGQFEIAIESLRESAKNGDWMCLKNLHLVTAWLPTLEKELNQLELHEDFRLWLTTEPHAKFSRILLQSSLKVTFESPPGIKNNLQRTYEGMWSPEAVARGSPLRAQAMFVLAWFHAILQERRRFVPQGFVKMYEFSAADLRVGSDVIDSMVTGASVEGVDWKAVRGIFENSIYGGRVDNTYDFRVLQSYLQVFFEPDLFNKGAGGSRKKPLKFGVTLPSSTSYAEYMALIGQLPELDEPALFGLPSNIDRSVQLATSQLVIGQLKTLVQLANTQGGFDRDAWAAALSPILNSWSKLTANDKVLRQKTVPITDSMSPVDAFVALERNNAGILIGLVDDQLQHLSKVVNGSALVTPELQSIAASLLRDEVPPKWEKKWEGPESVIPWMRMLVERMMALGTWVDKTKGGKLLGSPVNLGDLFRPQTFLNALRQQTARQSKLSMDNLKLICSWNPAHLGSAPVKCVLEGLSMQGCVFEGDTLAEMSAESTSIVPCPNVTLAYVPVKEKTPYSASESVPLPVYESTTREKIVTELLVPCGSGGRAKWVLTGSALFLTS